MARVNGSLGALVQGVSQQPARARRVGQTELQENILNDEVFGLSRRPGTIMKGSLPFFSGAARGEVQAGEVSIEGATLPYLMRMQPSSGSATPQMYISEDGLLKIVDIDPNSEAYLQEGRPDKYVLKEVGDTTFVLNPKATPSMLSNLPTAMEREPVSIYLRGAQYATGFSINLERVVGGVTENHVVTYATPDGSSASHTEQAQVKYILRQLLDIIDGSAASVSSQSATDTSFVPEPGTLYASSGAPAAFTDNFSVRLRGDHLIIRPDSSTEDFKITVTDTSGSNLFVAVRIEVDDVGLLPTRATVGQIVRVTGSNRAEDDFYVRWTVDGESIGTAADLDGSWNETTAVGEEFQIDPATMPQRLYKDGPTWRIEPVEWEERKAGDNNSNPPPEFIGEPIQDIADFQGRAVFLHGYKVALSRSEEYTSWFRTTASTKLATDPISVFSTATKGTSTLIYAIPFNRDLILFGTGSAQFILPGRNTVTTDTVAMSLTAEFEVDLSVRPQVVGDSIMFTSYSGQFTQVHEMYLVGNADRHERRTVTDHVPRYIQGRPSMMAVDDGYNMAAIVTDRNPRRIYVYEYLWQDGRRTQSAWNTWKLPAEVKSIRIEEGKISLLLRGEEDGFILAEALLYREEFENLEEPLFLDLINQAIPANGYVDVPFAGRDEDLEDLVVVQLDGPRDDGSILPTSSVVRQTTNVPGHIDYARITLDPEVADAALIAVGQRFNSVVQPTMPSIRDGDGVTISGTHLNVSSFYITFKESGPFTMTRQCQYEDPADYWTLEYTGQEFDDPEFLLGELPISSGTVTFPFEDLSTTSSLYLECSTHLPWQITEIEWEGNANSRSRRITNGG